MVNDLVPNVTRESRKISDTTARQVQVIHCGCGAELIATISGSAPHPPISLQKIAINAGWRFDAKRGRHACPDCIKKERPSMAEPRTPEPKDRRKIFARLMEVYDEKNGRYCDDFTDQSVGKALGVPWAWVSEIREQNFGPAGNVEMARVKSELGQLRASLEEAMTASLDRAAKLETHLAAVDDLRKRVDALEAAQAAPRLIRSVS